MVLWRKHKSRTNLINSAIIELFEYIQKGKIRKLIDHLVQNYKTDFEESKDITTFKDMIAKYNQRDNQSTNRYNL